MLTQATLKMKRKNDLRGKLYKNKIVYFLKLGGGHDF